MSHRTPHVRDRWTRDGRWLRRARSRFVGLLQTWAYKATDPCEFRGRVHDICRAMLNHGLLSKSSANNERLIGFSVCIHWRRKTGLWWGHWRRADVRHDVALMSRGEMNCWLSLGDRRAR